MDDKIQELSNQLSEIASLEQHLIDLESDIQEAYHDLERSEKVLKKEYQDVVQLEERSNNWLYRKLRGDQEDLLEKERAEYYEAFLQTKEARKSIELLEFEKVILSEKRSSLQPRQFLLKKELLELLEEQEKAVSAYSSEKRSKLRIVNIKMDQQHRLIKETQDCMEVCQTMISNLKELFGILHFIHEEKLLYDQSKRGDLNLQVADAAMKYRQINNKRKRLKKELRQLYKKMPTPDLKDILNQGRIRAQMMKEIIPPAFLDPSFSQKKFWRVSLFYSIEEIEKLRQHLEQLTSFLQVELDFLLGISKQLHEEKEEILLKN